MATITINNENLVFDKVWYVHAERGKDDGLGAIHSPFKTIDKALEVMTAGEAIYLQGTNGTKYFSTNKSLHFTQNTVLIGDCEKTVLDVAYPNNEFQSASANVSFYRMRIEGHEILRNSNTSKKYSFYNCYIDLTIKAAGYPAAPNTIYYYNCFFSDVLDSGGYGWYRDDCLMTNCVIQGAISHMGGYGTVKVENTLINDRFFATGNATSFSWSKKPILDPTRFYSLAMPEYVGMGGGFNPDKTPADLGLYGGPYAWGVWERPKNIFKVDNQHFTVKNDEIKLLDDLKFDEGCEHPTELFKTRTVKVNNQVSNTIPFDLKNPRNAQITRGNEGYLQDTFIMIDVSSEKYRINSSAASYKFFDKDISTHGALHKSTPTYVGQNFTSIGGKEIAAYTIIGNQSGTFAAKGWYFEGSDDGKNWTNIQTVKESRTWANYKARSYWVPRNKIKRYNQYRINFMATSSIYISEVIFYEGV